MSIFANKKTLKSTKLRLTKSQVENIFFQRKTKNWNRLFWGKNIAFFLLELKNDSE